MGDGPDLGCAPAMTFIGGRFVVYTHMHSRVLTIVSSIWKRKRKRRGKEEEKKHKSLYLTIILNSKENITGSKQFLYIKFIKRVYIHIQYIYIFHFFFSIFHKYFLLGILREFVINNVFKKIILIFFCRIN